MKIVSINQKNAVPVVVVPSAEPVHMNAKIAQSVAYKGAFTFEPSDVEQVICVKGTTVQDNILIKAIPNTYGKISYNGSVLTII